MIELEATFPGAGVIPAREGDRVTKSDFLDRDVRTGTWEELAEGTFKQAVEAAGEGDIKGAIQLINVSLLEAQELREVYEIWPERIAAWMKQKGVDPQTIEKELADLTGLIGEKAMAGIEAAWPEYEHAVAEAVEALEQGSPHAQELIETSRLTWLKMHDEAVDRVSGLVSIATKTCGEHWLGELWDFLMGDWYGVHEKRYSLDNQPWETSVHQLLVSIVDGFHAHLAGVHRQGDMQVIREADRIGFRFAPCGSGGRSVAAEITDGEPRSGHPYNFAVTTEKHDWAWNKEGICSYCVHCCQLNEIMPIDRLGYPTRVIDAPIWSEGKTPTHCTWWVYRHPSLIPDKVYTRVGRSPDRRPAMPPEIERKEEHND